MKIVNAYEPWGEGRGLITISLSRRNLQELLSSLDNTTKKSVYLMRDDTSSNTRLFVEAEEDELHYQNRESRKGLGVQDD